MEGPGQLVSDDWFIDVRLKPFWLFRPKSLARVPAMFAIDPPPGDPRHFRWDPDHWTYFCKVCNKYASDNHIKWKNTGSGQPTLGQLVSGGNPGGIAVGRLAGAAGCTGGRADGGTSSAGGLL